MRKNEALGLRWAFPGYERHAYQNEKEARSVLNLKEGLIFIPAELAKNHKSRNVPLSLDLIDMFKEAQKTSSKNEVFRIKEIKRSFDSAKKKAKVDRLRIHDLRHTAASRMVEAGVNVVDVCEIRGHSDLKITMRYCHASSEKKRQAIEKLSQIYGDSRKKVDIEVPRPVPTKSISPEKLLN